MNDFDSRYRDDATDDSPHVIQHTYDDETPASIAVIRAICALEDVDPMERPAEGGFVLHDHIDPTALDELLADSSGDGTTAVSFEIAAVNTYSILVDDAGHISIQYDHTS